MGLRLRLVPTLIALPALAVLIGLGVWQLERREWKLDLIARAEARLAAAPVPLEDALEDTAANEFAHVRFTGTFDHAHERRLFTTRTGLGPGYGIVTPLRLTDGRWVLVDRGFVPAPLAEPASRAEGQKEGQAEIVGWLRLPEPRGAFTPPDDPAHALFYARDPVAMGQGLPYALAAPIVVVADETPNPGGWPKGGMTLNFTNNHLAYAVTWFSLALILAVIFVLYHRRTPTD